MLANEYMNNCPIRSKAYSIIPNTDYQPTNTLLTISQLKAMSKQACALACLANIICLTATFKSRTGQCVLYFESMVNNQLTPFNGGYVLSTTKHNYGLSNLILLFSPTDSIFAIWNSGVGRVSSPSSLGFSYGQYPATQVVNNVIDRNITTKYLNFGNTTVNVPTTLGGVGSGFYITISLGALSILTRFRIATGDDLPNRDPFIVSIEGSNSGNLTQGTSWTLIYNGSTGLETDPGRNAFGPYQSVPNFKPFSSYRFLTLAKRSVDDSVQYSEVEFYGYLMKQC